MNLRLGKRQFDDSGFSAAVPLTQNSMCTGKLVVRVCVAARDIQDA